LRFGILLPHFSAESTHDRLFGFAPRLEALGYDSVWVRDNLGFEPHGFELPGSRFVDPFITLAAVAARTLRIGLGTAVLTPFRHPAITAQLVGSLSYLAGAGRVELGVGPGTPRRPWELVDIPFEQRVRLCREMVEVIRGVAGSDRFTYEGEITRFTDFHLDPAPAVDLTVWYGGASNTAIRAISDYADGLLPGRCPFLRYDVAAERLRESMGASGRRPRLGSIPTVSIAATREEALAALPIDTLLKTATERWKQPFDRFEDLAGAVVAGGPADICEQLQAFRERDVDLIVVDMRLQMAEFEEAAEQFATEVMPAFTRSSGASG
jgi:alkanesulfonate monooxygenase SsuD/methylene tetrahydromethanopterin reductase-like flavin-dependent oxidoreductase (luciferase family)